MPRIETETVNYPNLTPENAASARQLRDLISPSTLLYRQASGDPSAFGDLDALATRNFRQQTLPSLDRQFSKAGLLGSSSYADALARSRDELRSKLAVQRNALQSQALNQVRGINQQLQANPEFIPRTFGREETSFSEKLREIGSGSLYEIAKRVFGGIGGAISGGIGGLLSGEGFFSGAARGAFGGSSQPSLYNSFFGNPGSRFQPQPTIQPPSQPQLQPIIQPQPSSTLTPSSEESLGLIQSQLQSGSGNVLFPGNDPANVDERKKRNQRGRI